MDLLGAESEFRQHLVGVLPEQRRRAAQRYRRGGQLHRAGHQLDRGIQRVMHVDRHPPCAHVRIGEDVRKIVDGWVIAENDKSHLDRLLSDQRKVRDELNEQVRTTLSELAALCSALELSIEVREETLDDVAVALSAGIDSEAFARLTDQQRRLASIQREIDAAQNATVSNGVTTSTSSENASEAFARWEAEYGTRVSEVRDRVDAILTDISLPNDPSVCCDR